MKGLLFLVFCTFCVASTNGKMGECDGYGYNVLVRGCQVDFVAELQASHQPFSDCQNIFLKARACMVKVVEKCFNKTVSSEEMMKVKQEQLKEFGSKTSYCEFGGIPSIKPAIMNLNQTVTKCKKTVNKTMVENCENPFYDEFRQNPSSPELCRLSKQIHYCHIELLSYCDLTFRGFNDHFEPIFCPKIARDIKENVKVIQDGGGHSTSWNVIAPLIVFAILVVIALIVGFCVMARRQPKESGSKKQTKSSQIEKKNEPKTEGEEMVPLSTVVTNESNAISSA